MRREVAVRRAVHKYLREIRNSYDEFKSLSLLDKVKFVSAFIDLYIKYKETFMKDDVTTKTEVLEEVKKFLVNRE
jgi:hypothetical protein